MLPVVVVASAIVFADIVVDIVAAVGNSTIAVSDDWPPTTKTITTTTTKMKTMTTSMITKMRSDLL